MQSNVTTVDEVSKCVSAAVELPRESGLPFVADVFEERVGIPNIFMGSHDRPKFRPDRSDLQAKLKTTATNQTHLITCSLNATRHAEGR